MKAALRIMALGTGLALGLTTAALAQGDSSANASGGFVRKVEASQAVVLRVPTNEQGQEQTDAAEMRLYQGADVGTSADLRQVFEKASDINQQPQLSQDDIDRDSSTSGWYGWRNRGWQYNYYYNYQPSYYYYGNHYRYNYGWYNYYPSYGYPYGYRYYYYPRCW